MLVWVLGTELPLNTLKVVDRILSRLVFWILNFGMALNLNSRIRPPLHIIL